MGSLIEKTQSICPVCKKIVKADIIEENDSAYMVKNCEEHGIFRAIIARYSWYYKSLNSLYDMLFPKGHCLSDKTIRTILFYPTSKCNLSCSICYSFTGENYSEKSLDEVKRMIRSIKGKKIINILGGEPTVREDIFEIIKFFSRAGHFIEFYTNGIKLKDIDYVRRIKNSGVGIVQIGVDTLSDDAVYEKMRGKSLLREKKAALDNLGGLNVKTGIIDVILRGVTERYLSEIIDFTIKNRFIYEISVRGYSHIGRLGFSTNEEFTIDELVSIFEKETNGLVTLEEFCVFQKITYILRYILYNTPQCYMNQHIFLPRYGKKMRDIFPPDQFNRHICLFEEMFKEYPLQAKIFFLNKIFSKIVNAPFLFLQRGLKSKIPWFDSRYYIPLEFAMFYTPYNLDLDKTNKRCVDAWLLSYSRGKLEDYCSFLCSTTPLDNKFTSSCSKETC